MGRVPWLALYSALRRALQLFTALEGPLLESSSFSIASLATSEVDFGKYVLLGGCIAFSACLLPVDGWNFRVARGLKVSNNHRIFKARVLFLAVWLSNSVVSFQFHLPGTTPIVFSRLGSWICFISLFHIPKPLSLNTTVAALRQPIAASVKFTSFFYLLWDIITRAKL